MDEDGFVVGHHIDEEERIQQVRADDGEAVPTYSAPNFNAAREYYYSTLPKRVRDPNQQSGFRLAQRGETRSHTGEPAVLYDPIRTDALGLDEFGN